MHSTSALTHSRAHALFRLRLCSRARTPLHELRLPRGRLIQRAEPLGLRELLRVERAVRGHDVDVGAHFMHALHPALHIVGKLVERLRDLAVQRILLRVLCGHLLVPLCLSLTFFRKRVLQHRRRCTHGAAPPILKYA